ncbi:hypothetical protein [Geoalkalibacter halelectricus]|uniref:hypothetical protein n=1 Tax=Geoalkalibacter halelectricus TaxID=2847045 RepID=UPI00266F694E|nr:hypothetical protein [Geoalkalibacter halelectricus]
MLKDLEKCHKELLEALDAGEKALRPYAEMYTLISEPQSLRGRELSEELVLSGKYFSVGDLRKAFHAYRKLVLSLEEKKKGMKDDADKEAV